MPGLASYEKRMRDSGLLVIGVARKSTRDAALDVARQAGVDFPVVDGGTLPGVQDKVPQYTLYDHTGAIAHRQTQPSDDQAGLAPETRLAIDKALSQMGPVLSIPVESYQEPEIAKLARRANSGTALGRVLTELDAKIASGSEAERIEGERLRDEIVAYGERVMADADAARQDRPHRHFDMMREAGKQFKGHDLGVRADAVVAEIRKDRAAMQEVEASRLYEELTLAPESERMKIYGTLKKKYAQTRFAEMAANEIKEPFPAGGAPVPPAKDDDGDDDDEEDDD